MTGLVERLKAVSGRLTRSAGSGARDQQPDTGLRAAVTGAVRLALRSPLYRMSLAGKRPTALAVVPADPWTGDSQRGLQILQGNFTACGQSFPIDARVWAPVGAHDGWRADLHGFLWLRDLVATGHEEGRARARELLAAWLATQGLWDQVTWRADVLGNRLTGWVCHYAYLADGLPADIQSQFLDQIAMQARHLARVATRAPPGALRLQALRGLVLVGLALGLPERSRDRARTLLVAEVKRQIFADGGHISRSPHVHQAALKDLIHIRDALHRARVEVPSDVIVAIDRMAPWLRFMRHGDGGLALFNDTNEDEAATVDAVLQKADGTGAVPAAAPHSGFQRLVSGRTVLVVDAGSPGELDGSAHAGTLSFEVSFAKERLIVNCGAHFSDRSEWRRVQRATAAHSTVSIDDVNSAEVLGPCSLWPGSIGHRPRQVTAVMQEQDGHLWLDLSHDGYLARFGLLHHRRLFMTAGGEDIRGEDTLSPPAGITRVAGQRFTARFHLHPRANAMMVQDGTAVLIRLSSGVPWRFRASGGQIAVSASVYLGRRGEMKHAQQIVVTGPLTPTGAQIKWSLRREGKG